MHDTITVPRDVIPAARILLADSALGYCTTVTDHGTHLEVALRWPSISRGEEVLWRLLDSMTFGDLAQAQTSLDAVNRGVLVAAVADLLTQGMPSEVSA